MKIFRDWFNFSLLLIVAILLPRLVQAQDAHADGGNNAAVYSFVFSGARVPLSGERFWFIQTDGIAGNEFEGEQILMSTVDETGRLQLSSSSATQLLSLLSHPQNLRVKHLGAISSIRVEHMSPTDFKLHLTYICGAFPIPCVKEVPVDPDAQVKVARSFYTQQGFPEREFARDFSNWKKQLKADLDSFLEECPKDAHGFPLRNEAAEVSAFGNSIDSGKKGNSLREALIKSIYVPAPRILPQERMMLKMLLSEEARPVGFGGNFLDNGRTVELWYVVFHDMEKLTNGDLKEISAFSVFKPPLLPQMSETRRNSWPALVFVRDEKGQLKLFSMSRELALILERLEFKAMR